MRTLVVAAAASIVVLSGCSPGTHVGMNDVLETSTAGRAGALGSAGGGQQSLAGSAGQSADGSGGQMATGGGGMGASVTGTSGSAAGAPAGALGGAGGDVAVAGGTTATSTGGLASIAGNPSTSGAAGGSGSPMGGATPGIGGANNSGSGGTATGGMATGGMATGGMATGGMATGGMATGGMATGGTATGGMATGGMATGGMATGGAPHQFLGGPCVIAPSTIDTTSAAYARGDDGNVYRALYSAGVTPSWSAVSGITGADIASTADLDCNASSDNWPIHLVAPSATPLGAVLHTSSTDGTNFTAFATVVGVSTSLRPSVIGGDTAGNYGVFVTSAAIPSRYYYIEGSTLVASILTPTPALTKSLVSGIDADRNSLTINTDFVGYADDGTLALIDYYSYISSGWATQYFAAPSGTTFQYSPAYCISHHSGNNPQHIVVVADSRLWHCQSTDSGYTTWEKMSDLEVTSAPDCATSSYGAVVNAVALTPRGTVLHVHGSSGAFSAVDLGVFR